MASSGSQQPWMEVEQEEEEEDEEEAGQGGRGLQWAPRLGFLPFSCMVAEAMASRATISVASSLLSAVIVGAGKAGMSFVWVKTNKAHFNEKSCTCQDA